MKKNHIVALVIVVLFPVFQVNAQMFHPVPKKKLLFFGWTSPSTIAFRVSLAKFENPTFDGLGIIASKEVDAGNIFMVDVCRNISKEARDKEMQVNPHGVVLVKITPVKN